MSRLGILQYSHRVARSKEAGQRWVAVVCSVIKGVDIYVVSRLLGSVPLAWTQALGLPGFGVLLPLKHRLRHVCLGLSCLSMHINRIAIFGWYMY